MAIFTPIQARRILAGIGGVDIGIVWHERNYHKSGKGKRTIVKHGNLVQSFMVARITVNNECYRKERETIHIGMFNTF